MGKTIVIGVNLLMLVYSAWAQCHMYRYSVIHSENHLTELSQNFFNPNAIANVLCIDLSRNQLTIIRNQTFIGAINTQYLSLSGNRIGHLEKNAFYGMIMLITLNLWQNHLKIFNMDIILPCSRLQSLIIGKNTVNQLQYHENKTLPIQELILSDNLITDLTILNYFPNLFSLALDSNPNLSLSSNTFSNNPMIFTLDLSRTGLQTSKGFDFLYSIPYLKNLALDQNNLTDMKLESLPKILRLETLQIGSCYLSDLDFELLKQKFPNLQSIYKAGNHFGCWRTRQLNAFLQKHNIVIIENKPSAFDVDDDMECYLNSFDITLLVVLTIVGIAVLFGMCCVVRCLCCCKKSDQPKITNLEGIDVNLSADNQNVDIELQTPAYANTTTGKQHEPRYT